MCKRRLWHFLVVLLFSTQVSGLAWGNLQLIGKAAPGTEPPTLIYGADSLFPPLSFKDLGTGKYTGFEVELIQEIGKVMGYTVEVRLDRWSSIKERFEDGQIDVVGMYENPSRYGIAAFGDPYATGHSEIFVRQDGPMFDSLGALEGHTVAIESSSLASDSLKSLRPGIKWVELGSGADVIRAVASSEVDAGIAAQYVGRWAMKEYGLRNVTTSGPPILQSNIALCVRPGRGELLLRLNEGLTILKANGTYSELYERWLTPHNRPALDWKAIVKWAMILTLPLLVLVVATLTWNRMLAARVASRTQGLRLQLEDTKRAEALLAQSRVRAASLVEFAPEAILVVRRADGVVLEANPQAQHLFASPLSGLIGRPLSSLLGPNTAEASSSSQSLLSAGIDRPARVSAFARGAADRPVPCEWWAVELPPLSITTTESDRTLRVSVIDVSELVHVQQHRESLERELDHARQFEAMGRLAGGIVHDVNNLLTTVVGCVRLIGPEIPAGSRGHRTLATLESAADQGAGLTRRLLDYVRGSTTQPGIVDMVAVVNQALPFLREVVADARVRVQWSAPAHPMWASADPVELRQILFNLADNSREAFLASPSDTRERLLLLSAHTTDGQHALVVEDTGPGMSPQDLARCFEPFFSTRADIGGSGLGLSTCRDLAQAMGGTLAASSRVGHGSRLELRLPAASPPHALSRVVATSQPAPPVPTRAYYGVPEALGTILLVEDNQPVREVLTLLLTRTGRRVLTASGEAEARAHAASLAPGDLVISDVNLSARGGEEAADTGVCIRLLSHLRARVPGLRLVVMSGSLERLRDVEAAALGLEATLLKPFAPEVLEALVGRLLDPGAGVPR